MPGTGNRNADILIVGLAPGKDGADITGIPFTRDPSGRLLQSMLEKVGLSRDQDVYITNIVKCNPKDAKGNNRNPTSREIGNCCSYLDKEIELVNPRLIVPLGVYVTEYFLRRNCRMKDCHGQVFLKDGKIIFPLYHPGFVVRNAYSVTQYEKDFEKLDKFRKVKF